MSIHCVAFCCGCDSEWIGELTEERKNEEKILYTYITKSPGLMKLNIRVWMCVIQQNGSNRWLLYALDRWMDGKVVRTGA